VRDGGGEVRVVRWWVTRRSLRPVPGLSGTNKLSLSSLPFSQRYGETDFESHCEQSNTGKVAAAGVTPAAVRTVPFSVFDRGRFQSLRLNSSHVNRPLEVQERRF